jgi:predicted porin
MKRQLLALVALCPLAGTAHAHSRVTLYGLIDEGFEALSNVPVTGKTVGGRQYRLDATFGLNGPRGGLRGTEDLGGGLAAVFTLEDGFELNTGKLSQDGAEFGRQAFVGLSSNWFGTVTLGRQCAGAVDYLGGFEFGDSDVGTRRART